jgi:hypothetical protein
VGAWPCRSAIQEVKKLKCTLLQALRLCTGRTTHRGSRGIALLFHDHGTRRGWGVSVTPRPLFTHAKNPVPIVQEAGRAPGPVWTGTENFAPPGFDPRTGQPLASRYTNYATRPTLFKKFASFYETRMFITGKQLPTVDSILCHLHGIHSWIPCNSKILIKTLLKANFSLAMLVLLSVRVKQLVSPWTVIHEILYWGF